MEGQEDGVRKMESKNLEQSLFDSSTKRRCAVLSNIENDLEGGELSVPEVRRILSLLFETYPLYIDRPSRYAVQRCLRSAASSEKAPEYLPDFIESLKNETKKPGIASANAFVLVEWSTVLLEQIIKSPKLWKKWGLDVLKADAAALELCMGSDTRDSVKKALLVVARRGLRRVLITELGKEYLGPIVSALTAKGSLPTAKNAVILGVIAGVSARLRDVKPASEELKKEYYTFYVREIIGSKGVLPQHIATGLRDFFVSFTTLEDLQKELVPAIEKALLRAPEVVLNDLVSPMVEALPRDIDLSAVLRKNLLKPLLSNVKSTNATIRDGALTTFQAIAKKSSDNKEIGAVADEILNPLKQNKITVPDQKVIHAKMLASLTPSTTLASKIPSALAPIALKEPNEAVIEAEIQTITFYIKIKTPTSPDELVSLKNAFVQGLADKRPSVRRKWAVGFGEIVWSIKQWNLVEADFISFCHAVLSKMADVFTEVAANPLPSAQNGLATVAYVFVAACLSCFEKVKNSDIIALIKEAAISNQLHVTEGKPAFLLNFRVYSKLTTTEDAEWAILALSAIAKYLVRTTRQSTVEDAWAQCFIYFITASTVAPQLRKKAQAALTAVYCQHPEQIGSIMVAGLWQWRRRVDLDEKDTAASAARTGNDNLYLVVRALCPTPDMVDQLPDKIDESARTLLLRPIDLLIKLMVLSHDILLPKVSWIDTCLRTGIDPGELVNSSADKCFDGIIHVTENYTGADSSHVHTAAYQAAADLAFVAPESIIPKLVAKLRDDLDTEQLANIGSTEASIFRTPEGTPFIDVLASKNQAQVLDKKVKDYDILKFEEELRASISQKTGKPKKLTPDEQAKVAAQLAKESTIRAEVRKVDAKIRRGVGFVHALATVWPTEAEMWIVQAVDLLSDVIEAGAGLVVGDAAALAYLDCAQSVTQRLGPLRKFVGVATLRAIGVTQLPPELVVEPLQDLITRIMYRLKFLGEQRPFDTVSLAYILPLVFLVLQNGGFAENGSDEADEQLILALQFLACHTEVGANARLPRRKLLTTLISSMQSYTQHYKLIKDCLIDYCHHLDPTITEEELGIIVRGTIVPEVSVRTATLQAIDAELDLSGMDFCEEIWIACHDDIPENVELAQTIWEESDFMDQPQSAVNTVTYLESTDKQLRRAAARTLAETVSTHPEIFSRAITKLEKNYLSKSSPLVPQRDEFGMIRKKEVTDPWEARSGVALAFKELASVFDAAELVAFVRFLVDSGPLSDRYDTVRDEMIDAATTIISVKGGAKVEDLMELFETALESPDRGPETDKVNEAVIILYGALARHLKSGDERVPKVVQRLLNTLSTPSETVQYAVAECLPPLVQASQENTRDYVQQMLDELLQSKKYASRRGAAYGLAGIVSGKGIFALREFRIMSTLKGASEAKKDQNQRQGAFLAYELLSMILGIVFEPYVIQIVPQLLVGFGDTSGDVRDACLDAAKICFANLSSYGVQQVLPTLLEGLDETQWRSKKGACDSLGAMAYLDPQQLALSLPDIIPPLTTVLTDSHKEVRGAANRALQRFGEVISNPEIKSVVNILLKALSDPTKYTEDALDALIKINFMHFLDAPSLALVVRILERGLGERSSTKRKASQIIGSLAHLTERKDLTTHLPILVAGLRVAIVDPVPTTRATASKALGSTIEKLGEDALPDLIPSLMATLKSDTGAGDRLGSAQALSEVLAGLGTTRLEETLPTILQNVSSSKATVREGFMSLFIFLPACFGNSFSNYLSKIIPPILTGLADDIESIRETALRAGRLLVKNFATRAIDLLLPELERGLADDSYRIRLSSVELVGDLLFNLTGISAKAEEDDVEDNAAEAGQSLLEVLGEEKRNRVLSAIYICRNDTSGQVRAAAINVWKALVATPRTLREIIPTLTQLIIRRLASSNMEQKVIAGNALGELIRKAGEGVMTTLLPTLEEGLHSTDTDAKQGICIALRELISSASPESLEDYEKTLVGVVRTALVDSNAEVREAAAEAFDSLQRILGKKAVDSVLPYLLNLLRTEDGAENALAALLTLLTETTRSNIILPNLLPTLLTSPMTSFNARALASLAEVASSAMTRRLSNILNAIMDNIVTCKDPELLDELNAAFDAVLLSVDEYEGLNTAVPAMLALVKHNDHRRRAAADLHLAKFFEEAENDISRYYPDLIRVLLLAFDDGDTDVVKAAWMALSALTKRLKKEEMESLVFSTRQVLNQVGVAGSNLPGFGLPKGINAILPIFLQGLMNGTADQRTQSALAISDIIDRTSGDSLKPFVTQITGPLIRVVSERSVDVKAAILFTLNNLLEKIPTFLKPFLPQLQRTFAKSLADTSSEVLRTRAAKALGTLITLTPRIDPLIAELITGSKTGDAGVKNAMLKALYEVVSKAGGNMSEVSRNSILSLIDMDTEGDDSMTITNAKLLGALVKVLPADSFASVTKTRIIPNHQNRASILALNATLVEAGEALTTAFPDETVAVICNSIKSNQTFISENAILAAGKYLLTPNSNKSFEVCKQLFEALAYIIPPGHPLDARRLSLVVLRTISRSNNGLIRPHLPLLTPPIFASVRDPVIPVKLAAEACFLAIFDVVDEESAVWEKYINGPAGEKLPAATKRSMNDYFKRVVLRLATQARERRDAEGGAGGLGLSSDEVEDEREVWSVGRVELGEGAFGDS
ncbi:ARM repeat-containing protein, partial [Tothia fuscella]